MQFGLHKHILCRLIAPCSKRVCIPLVTSISRVQALLLKMPENAEKHLVYIYAILLSMSSLIHVHFSLSTLACLTLCGGKLALLDVKITDSRNTTYSYSTMYPYLFSRCIMSLFWQISNVTFLSFPWDHCFLLHAIVVNAHCHHG